MEDEEKRLRMAIIAGASEAARFKNRNWRATEEEVIQHVTDNANNILKEIDDPL